jgi:hypothetical protein
MTHEVDDVREFRLKTPPLKPDRKVSLIDLTITSLDEQGLESSFDILDYVAGNVEGGIIGVEDVRYDAVFAVDTSLGIRIANQVGGSRPSAGTNIGALKVRVEGDYRN